ncbi:MAG: hypothetical protein ACREAG_03550 [Nitrosopumilaceae archaeon]
MEEGALPQNQSIIDFILHAIPTELKPEVSIELIDEIITYISS